MVHNKSIRFLGALLAALLALSNCATNDPVLKPEQQESPETVESTDPPSTNPVSTVTTLPRVETSTSDRPDDSHDLGLYLPKLLDSILVDHPSGQQPIVPTGDMPLSIIASTEACEIIVVDAATGETTKLWEYKYISRETAFYYCGPYPDDLETLESILPPNYEIGPSFVEDLEWVDTGYILISMCCEPAAGRFELLAMPGTSETEEPPRRVQSGRFPSISDDGSLLFVSSTGAIELVVLEEFDVYSDNASDPSYNFTGSSSYYELSVDQEDISSGIRGFIGDVSWLDNDRIAFDLWSFDFDLPGSDVFSWIGVIDLTRQSVSLNSRNPGWSIPTGDELGNLVVTEQPCNYFVMKCEDRSRIVTVDSQTLLPIHELEVDGNIADMDLERGWLLITLTDGRMGTID